MSKKILILGAGMVSAPCVDFLLRHQFTVTIVSSIQKDLDTIRQQFPTARVVLLDVAVDSSSLQDLIREHDIVISILPSHLHALVARCCIDCKKCMVNASYISDDLRALHNSASAADITILGEVGLDPGFDHMLAMSCIDSVKQQGGQVTGYTSLCGGIPAPESSYGPLRYKFSWYPKGMFISALKEAKHIQNGQVTTVQAGTIFDSIRTVQGLIKDSDLEDIPNRDSTGYRDVYNIQSASTVYRGTLRYKGFSEGMRALISLGFTSSDNIPQLSPDAPRISWRELTSLMLQLPSQSSVEEIKAWLQSHHDLSQDQWNTIFDLGLLSEDEVRRVGNPLDTLCAYVTTKLAYGPREKDMVVMRNIIEATLANGQRQQHTFDLVEMGQAGGHSAMARTVGLTVAISACLVLEGSVERKGVILPVSSDVYQPVLKKLVEEGIRVKSTVTQLDRPQQGSN